MVPCLGRQYTTARISRVLIELFEVSGLGFRGVASSPKTVYPRAPSYRNNMILG